MSSHHTPRDDHHAPPLILVVDDDPGYSALVQRWLQRSNFRVETHSDAESLLDALSRTLPDAVCLDLGLPGMGGMEVLPLIRQRHRTVPIIILTGDTTVDSVVQAIQNGAYDYVPKTADRHKLITTIRNAVDSFHQSARLSELRREAEGGGMNGIVGRSPAMRAVFRQLERVSASDIQVLVHGETGSGKELVA
ncbi:MAG: response regulator, partial [Myxococcota bacterium]